MRIPGIAKSSIPPLTWTMKILGSMLTHFPRCQLSLELPAPTLKLSRSNAAPIDLAGAESPYDMGTK